ERRAAPARRGGGVAGRRPAALGARVGAAGLARRLDRLDLALARLVGGRRADRAGRRAHAPLPGGGERAAAARAQIERGRARSRARGRDRRDLRLRAELADARARTRRLPGDLERPGGELPALAPARLR